MKTTSILQDEYFKTLATLEIFNGEMAKIEATYCKSKGLAVDKIYCIDDDKLFEECNNEFATIEAAETLQNKIYMYENLLKVLKTKIIAWGLDLMPTANTHEREILKKACKTDYVTSEKVLAMTLKLDVSTIPA